MNPAFLPPLELVRRPLWRTLGIALLPLALAACDSGSSTGGNALVDPPVVTPLPAKSQRRHHVILPI